MLRTLPAQRFKLVVREEKREMAVYALTTGGDRKPGRQLTPVAVDCQALMEARRRGAGPPVAPPSPLTESVA